MKINKIEEEEHGLLILVDSDYEYFIPQTAYDSVIMGNISDWVHQVMGKKWADVDSLYKIGSILSKYCSGSGINWVDSFELVEMMRGSEANANPTKVKEKLKYYGFKI